MDSRDWRAYLVQTTTGVVGPELQIKDDGTFSLPLAGDSSGQFTLDKTDLPQGVDLNRWLDGWWASILFTFQGRAIFAGPITSIPREYHNEIQFQCAGIRSILARRYAVEEADLDSAKIAKGIFERKGYALGTIAQDVVRVALAKPGGNLPISFVAPRQFAEHTATYTRTYKAYDINNLNVDTVLTKLSEDTQGPDIMFRPKLIDNTQMVWEMHNGTKGDFRIAQSVVPEWDLTAVQNQAASLEAMSVYTSLTDRVVSVGSGTNQAAVMAVAEDHKRLKMGYPLLESVSSGLNSSWIVTIRNNARTKLSQNRKPQREFTFFVDAYGEYPLGTYWPGDKCIIYTKGWHLLNDGPNEFRILSVQGSFGKSQVRLSMQLDSQWEFDGSLE